MKRILLSIFIIGFIAVVLGGTTTAIFSSQTSLEDNNFSTGTWYTGPDVVVNELMWMGSVGSPSDEWIELRNMTSSPINLAGWKLTKVDSIGTESLMMTIASGTISANGYFLISNYSQEVSAINVTPNLVSSSVDLNNSNLKVRLYSGDWTNPANLIDTAGDEGTPLKGLNGTQKQSMSRNSTPGDGTLAGSWYTDTISNSLIYWDSVGDNYGTPGGPNV